MIQEKLVISDTNILLDLISVDMLEDFFSLPCDFSTTDFVISEIIQPAQIKAIEKYTKLKKLDIVSFSFEEIIEITDIHSNKTFPKYRTIGTAFNDIFRIGCPK